MRTVICTLPSQVLYLCTILVQTGHYFHVMPVRDERIPEDDEEPAAKLWHVTIPIEAVDQLARYYRFAGEEDLSVVEAVVEGG
jgi:hypothetical protein